MNIEKNKYYTFSDAVDLLKKSKKRNFKETIDVSIKLNIAPKNKNITIKGYSCLPNNIEKKYKICVFSTDSNYKPDENLVLLDEESIKNFDKKKFDFDIVVTNPKSIIKMGKLTKILSSRKIMPEVQYGTITNNIDEMILNINKNYIKFKNDKSDVINSYIGKIDLEIHKLKENLETLINDIKKNKPKNCKSMHLEKIFLSSTMGPGIKININSLLI